MTRRPAHGHARDRGSVAVEFALLLPLLLLIAFGIIDFGRALNAQITRTQAAAVGLSPVSVSVTSCPPGAGQGVNATVVTSYSFSFVTPVGAIAGVFGGSGFGSPITLSAHGVM